MKYKKIKSPTKKSFLVEIKDFSKGIDTVTNENVLDKDIGVRCYNFSYSSGALTSGIGFKEVEIDYSRIIDEKNPLIRPEGVSFKKVWQFKHWDNNNLMRRDKLMVWASDNNIYYCPLFSTIPELQQTAMVFNEEPENLNYKLNDIDYNICISTTDSMQIWDGVNNPYTYTTSPDIRSFCASNGKFYATFGGDRNVVRYTTNEDLTTWYVALEGDDKELVLKDNLGRINKVVSHLNYVYAFRDFGITKISRTANGVNTSNLFCSGNVIYDKTITICGNEIYFLCKDGVYKFDGSNVKKIDLKINSFIAGINNQNAVACFNNNNYYLALKLNFNDENIIGCESENFINNALLKISIEDASFEILRGVDICSIASIQFDKVEKVVACFNNNFSSFIGEMENSGLVFDSQFDKCWTSPLSDLGYSDNLKQVESFSITTQYECEVKIFSESEEKVVLVKPEDNFYTYRVNVKGKKIGVQIISKTQSANISNLKLNINLLEGKMV